MRFVKDWVDPQSGATLVSSDRESSLIVCGFDEEELRELSVLEDVAGIELVVAAHDPDVIALPAFAVLIKEGAHTIAAVELARYFLGEISGTECAYYLVTVNDGDWMATPMNIPGPVADLDFLSTVKSCSRKQTFH